MRSWGRGDNSESTRDSRLDAEKALPGVIDTIGFGFAALMLRPLVIIPVVLLDLYLLLGPRVTAGPMTSWIADATENRGDGWDSIAAEVERAERFNLFEAGVLAAPLVRTPAIVPSFGSDRVTAIGTDWTSSEAPIWVAIAVLIISLVVGLIVATIYRSLLASAAIPELPLFEQIRPRTVVRRATRLVGWAVTLIALATLIAMPVIVATIVGAILGFGSVAILWLFLLVPATWAWVHFFFSVHALFVDDAGPLEALRSSFQVVQRHFWQSVRFMAASVLITTGLSFALRELAANLPGALLAVMLNAVIVSGMIIAAMLFYRDRAVRLGIDAQVPER